MPALNLILLGDPTAGKATQAKALAKRYGMREFDFGNWLRNLKTAEEKRKVKFQQSAGKGKLTPTQVARAYFKSAIFKTPKSRGVFFNGNPKMLGEAQLMYKWFREAGRTDPIVIYLAIPQREVLKRIRIRAEEERRSDDDIRHLKNRMKYYAKDIRATVTFLKWIYRFKNVSGVGTRAEVRKRLLAAVEQLKKKPAKR